MDESTQPSSREGLIVDALADVFRLLGSTSPETAHLRELRSQARSYEIAVKKWTAFPPTYAQLDAIFEVVTELHGKVVEAGRHR